MVTSGVNSVYKNIHIVDMLNILKDYVKNDDQFINRTAVPQEKFLDLVNLVLTTNWCTFDFQFYKRSEGVSMEEPASSITTKVYIKTHRKSAKSAVLHPRNI